MVFVAKKKIPSRFAFAAVSMMAMPVVPAVAQAPIIDPVTECTIDPAFVDGYFAGLDAMHKTEGFTYPDNHGFTTYKGTANYNCGARSAWLCMEPLMKELDATPGVRRAVVETSLNARADYCAYIEKGDQFIKALGL